MTITAHWDEAPTRRADVGPMGADWDLLGTAAGCDRIGLRRIRVWPGKQSTPVHAHFGEEEMFYVLRGSGWSWQEGGAYYLTAWRLGRYYRTYPEYVEDEVTGALAKPDQFVRGPRTNRRGTATDHTHAFVVQEGNYLSARWPGDAYLFGERFRDLIE